MRNKNLKKILALSLAVTAVLGGVQVSASEGEKTKMIGMCWGDSTTWERMTEAVFENNPDLAEKYEVEWVVGGQSDIEVCNKVRLALSANEYIADFVVMNYTTIPEFAEAGVLNDLSSTLAQYEEELSEAAVNVAKYKDEVIGIPFSVKAKVWFYRHDIFEECGVDVTAIKNTDDFIAAGKKIQEKYPDSYMWNIGHTPSAYNYYLTLSGNGASHCDEEGTYNISQDAGVRAMLEDYKKMQDAGIIMDVSDWTTDWEAALANGNLVSQLSAGWLGEPIFLPTYAAGQEGLWSCAKWPEIGGTTKGSDAGGASVVIPTFSAHPEEAAEFLANMMISESGSQSTYEITASLPLNKKVQENDMLKKSVKDGFFGTSIIDAQLAAMDDLTVFNFTPKALAEQDITVEYFTKAVYGEMSIDDALEACENDLNTILGNAYQ